MGLALACGPAVSVDTASAGGASGGTFSDTLPPLTSTTQSGPGGTAAADDDSTTFPGQIFDVGGLGTGPPTDEPCNRGWQVDALHPVVVMVVDGSSTMVTAMVDHDADPLTEPTSRWFAVRSALEQSLWDWDATHDVGAVRFPAAASAPPDRGACDPDVDLAVPQELGASVVLETLPEADDSMLAGATPLRGALESAWGLLRIVEPGPSRLVVVVTDGAPNCTPGLMPPASFDEVDAQVEVLVADMAADEIGVAVISVDVPDALRGGVDGEPVANPTAVLDGIAAAGGLYGAAFDGADTEALILGLTLIRSTTLSRRLRIPDPSYGWYEIEVDGVVWQQVSDCTQEDGFVFVATEAMGERRDVVEMCGAAAGALERTGTATIYPVCVIAE